MKPTEEQLAVINALRKANNIKIYAYAGAGKTTTLKMLTQTYSAYKFLYLAFNRSIATEAKQKFPFNTYIRTTHALALSMVKNDLKVENPKNLKVIDIIDLYDIGDYSFAKLILDSFRMYCHSDKDKINEENIYSLIASDKDVLASYQILKKIYKNVLTETTEKVQDLWNKMIDGYIHMTHDFYLKYFQLNIDKYKYKMRWDVILLDEAQDTNDVTLDIFKKIPVEKKVMVGDVYQKIYGFRGSVNAMEKWNADIQLWLSTTFRFHSRIAQQANQILKNFRKESVLIKTVREPDNKIETVAFLSRTNSGLIEIADALIEKGKLFNTIRNAEDIFRLPLSVLGFIEGYKGIKDKWLFRFDSIEELREFAEMVNDIELKTAINIALAYKHRLYEIFDIVQGMNRLKANIFLSTAHTAKGLEWDRVIIWDNFPDFIDLFAEKRIESINHFLRLLSQNKKNALEIAEEINLFYVAITRAKKELINNSINKNYISLSPEDLDTMIKQRIEKLYEDTPL
ncbi:3'-5' exonuclease [Persephonella sp.]